MLAEHEYQTTVPGKVMLAGEYSVLFGGQCLATCIPPQMQIKTKRSSSIKVKSNFENLDLEFATSDISEKIKEHPQYKTLLDTISFAIGYFQLKGIELDIQSELMPQYGFGSSSALRLGILAGTRSLSAKSCESKELAHMALQLQKKQQVQASGYDIYTQYSGGLLLYQNKDNYNQLKAPQKTKHLYIYTLDDQNSIPTDELIRQTIKDLLSKNLLEGLDHLNACLIAGFKDFFESPTDFNYEKLVYNMAKQRRFLSECSNYPNVAKELDKLPKLDEEWSFKTTGAGGSDALIVLAHEPQNSAHKFLNSEGWKQHTLDINLNGLKTTALGKSQ